MENLPHVDTEALLRESQSLREEARTTGDICDAFPQLTRFGVLNHMAVLKEAGLIKERRIGTSRLYRADRAALRPLESYLRGMWTRNIDRLRLAAEAEERRRLKR